MVSTARLRSARERIVNLRAYALALEELLKDVVLSGRLSHPFLEQKSSFDKILLVIMTSDRGLCGAFNANICRFAEGLLQGQKEGGKQAQELFFIGKKGHDYFKFRGVAAQGLVLNLAREISYPLAVRIAGELTAKILSMDYDGVFVVYNEFKSVTNPRIVKERFLPFDLHSKRLSGKGQNLLSKDILFEVSPEKLLRHLLRRYFSIQIYRCLAENVAAEHGSRMAAMENASKNASSAVDSLSLQYNKLRQSSITTELTEVVAGAESLN